MNIREFSYEIDEKTFDELKDQVTKLNDHKDKIVLLSTNETVLSNYVHALAKELKLTDYKYEIWAKKNARNGTSFHVDCDEAMKIASDKNKSIKVQVFN